MIKRVLRSQLRNNKGLGLIEILVSLGLVGLVVSGLLFVVSLSTKEQQKMVFYGDANLLTTNLATTLSDPAQCQTALSSTSLLTTNRIELAASATAQTMPALFNIGGIPNIDYTVGSARYHSSTLTLQSRISGSKFSAILNVEVAPRNGDPQIIHTFRRIPLTVTMVDANPTSTIATCVSSNLIFSMGNAASFGAVTCPAKQVLTGISSSGNPECSSFFDMLPAITCAPDEYIGINPSTQNLFCVSAGAAPPVKTRGGGCTGYGCRARDGGPCYGYGCETNGNYCEGYGCVATNTF